MTILVTGANGLLATNTIQALLDHGYRVRGLIRNRSNMLLAPQTNFELVNGDITDLVSLEQAMIGCDQVVHCAATTDQSLLSYRDYYLVNVMGTDNVIKSALKSGIKKLVYVGTANTFGFGTLDSPGDETLAPQPPFTAAWYAKSKLEAQELVLAAKKDLSVTVVSPTFMIGPYDGKPSSGAIIRMGYGKRVVFHPPGGKNFVNVTDAAQGIVRALEHGKNGEAYLLAGENLSYKQFFKKLNQHTGKRQSLICVPGFILLAAGYFGDLCRWLGLRTALSSTNMKILCVRNYYTGAKAENIFGIRFRSIDFGIKEAIKWFREHGMLPR